MEFKEWLNEYVFDEKTRKMFDEWNYEIAINQGMEKGIIEGAKQNAIEIAKNLLTAGLKADFIATNTGLPLEQVEKLKQSLNTTEK